MYAVCKVAGKQYQVFPNKPLEVNFLGDVKTVKVPALLRVDDKGIKIGKPEVEELTLEVLESTQGEKIRVAKFHAKANYRRVTGSRPKYSKVVWKA
jgi:ribosomal protein L21